MAYTPTQGVELRRTKAVEQRCWVLGTALLGAIVGSGRWCGVNVGSRFIWAGFTGTRGVLVSAVPSAGVDGPASVLGGPGIVVLLMMSLAPSRQIDRGVTVPVGGMSATAGEHPIGERQGRVNSPAGRA